MVALAVTVDGAKVPVGLWLGDTENKRVVVDLLAGLVARGLDASGGLLVVIDGAKALRAAVASVFGDLALVQRCTLHKRRNVGDYLPKSQRAFVDRKLAKAFNDPDPDAGLHAARALAKTLERQHPTPPRACARVLRRCSPCAAWAWATGLPAACRRPTRSSR